MFYGIIEHLHFFAWDMVKMGFSGFSTRGWSASKEAHDGMTIANIATIATIATINHRKKTSCEIYGICLVEFFFRATVMKNIWHIHKNKSGNTATIFLE